MNKEGAIKCHFKSIEATDSNDSQTQIVFHSISNAYFEQYIHKLMSL